MNIIVIGAGSLGMLLSIKLAQLCNRLELVTRTENQADSLRIEGIGMGDVILYPNQDLMISSYEKKDIAPSIESADYVILAVKQFALDEYFIDYISSRLGKTAKLICFQNGIGHIDSLSSRISEDQIYVAVTTEGAKKLSSTRVAHTGSGITYIGQANVPKSGIPMKSEFQESVTEIKDLCYLLKIAGIRVETSNRIIINVWNKLVINSVINPLTAILRISNGKLLETESTIQLMRDLYLESLKVAKAASIELQENLWDQILEVCEKTAANHSSMLQDVIAERTTEIDWINGAILKLADDYQLDLPINRTVYHLVKTMELYRRKEYDNGT